MYERFYGLHERPFDLLPNPRFLYLGGRHREAFSNLRYGLTVPKGLTLLIAEAATSKTRFLFELRTHLQARCAAGGLSALVVDEAQSLSYELLEEVRLLSNVETPTVKLLNVVLVGQPEFAHRLNEPRLRELRQRVSLRCELEPFGFQDTAAYVAGRLRIAGGDPPAIFGRDAILAIHEASGGVPRVINVVGDNALIGGFAGQVKPVSRALVEEVCRDFALNRLAPDEICSAPDTNRAAAGANEPFDITIAPADEKPPPAKRVGEGDGSVFDIVGHRKRFLFS